MEHESIKCIKSILLLGDIKFDCHRGQSRVWVATFCISTSCGVLQPRNFLVVEKFLTDFFCWIYLPFQHWFWISSTKKHSIDHYQALGETWPPSTLKKVLWIVSLMCFTIGAKTTQEWSCLVNAQAATDKLNSRNIIRCISRQMYLSVEAWEFFKTHSSESFWKSSRNLKIFLFFSLVSKWKPSCLPHAAIV